MKKTKNDIITKIGEVKMKSQLFFIIPTKTISLINFPVKNNDNKNDNQNIKFLIFLSTFKKKLYSFSRIEKDKRI